MMRRLWRLPALAGLLAAGLATVLLVFPLVSRPTRERLIAVWSRSLLFACGTRVVLKPAADAESWVCLDRHSDPAAGVLFLANHVSWLDIFVIDSVAPASFVAKAEIANWPLAGTLVARAGTLFVERGRRHAVHAAVRQLSGHLLGGARAAVFPEGTTSDGERLLPFHGNLVQAALDAACPMVPLGLRYLDHRGEPSRVVPFVGDQTFLQSLWRIAGEPSLIAELHELAPIPHAPSLRRQHAANQARLALADRLGLPLDDRLPEILRAARMPHSPAARPCDRTDAPQ